MVWCGPSKISYMLVVLMSCAVWESCRSSYDKDPGTEVRTPKNVGLQPIAPHGPPARGPEPQTAPEAAGEGATKTDVHSSTEVRLDPSTTRSTTSPDGRTTTTTTTGASSITTTTTTVATPGSPSSTSTTITMTPIGGEGLTTLSIIRASTAAEIKAKGCAAQATTTTQGFDKDRDGVLSKTEVTQVTVQCKEPTDGGTAGSEMENPGQN